MGMVMVAYRNASRLNVPPDADDDELYETEGNFRLYEQADFPDQLDGFGRGWYRGEPVEFEKPVQHPALPIPSRRAISKSYSGYGAWREVLSQIFANAPAPEVWADPVAHWDRPFVPLIHFYDNEGAIGPRTSARLAEDFAKQSVKAAALLEEPDLATYDAVAEAFKAAAGTGFVLIR